MFPLMKLFSKLLHSDPYLLGLTRFMNAIAVYFFLTTAMINSLLFMELAFTGIVAMTSLFTASWYGVLDHTEAP